MRCQRQNRAAAQAPRDKLERGDRCRAGPVEILEDEDQRPRFGKAAQAGGERFEETRLLVLRIERVKRGEIRPAVRQLGKELACSGKPQRVDFQCGDQSGDVTQGFGEGLVGRAFRLCGPAPQDARALRLRTQGELGRKAGLSDARFAGEKDDRSAAAGRRAPQRVQPFEFARTTGKRKRSRPRLKWRARIGFAAAQREWFVASDRVANRDRIRHWIDIQFVAEPLSEPIERHESAGSVAAFVAYRDQLAQRILAPGVDR